MSKNKGFAVFLENPAVPRGEKMKKIEDLLEDGKFSYLTKNLIATLAANGKAGEVKKVVNAFAEMMEASRGVVSVKIISAETLKDSNLKTIEAAVIAMVGKDKKVNLETKVEPSILGGLQILVGEKFLDLSVASRVSSLSTSLDGAVVL